MELAAVLVWRSCEHCNKSDADEAAAGMLRCAAAAAAAVAE